MIKVDRISKSYDKRLILKSISIQINDGEFLAITGKSGQGKTTLLNIMGLLETADEGTICIDGKANFTHKDKTLFYRHNAGFLFQNFALIENETVLKNLQIGTAYLNLTPKQKIGKISAALEQVGLNNFENKKIYQLSGGEQQRIALARVILKEPQYIFADEPTGNLDAENRNLVFEQLKQLRGQGRTVIMVTHDMELAQANGVDNVISL